MNCWSRIRLFDVYTGEQLGEGKKSLAYALRFRAADRTLTVEEASAARDAAVALAGERTAGGAARLNAARQRRAQGLRAGRPDRPALTFSRRWRRAGAVRAGPGALEPSVAGGSVGHSVPGRRSDSVHHHSFG